jgi:hypothetical protein
VRRVLLSAGDRIRVPESYARLRGLRAWRYFDIWMDLRR